MICHLKWCDINFKGILLNKILNYLIFNFNIFSITHRVIIINVNKNYKDQVNKNYKMIEIFNIWESAAYDGSSQIPAVN